MLNIGIIGTAGRGDDGNKITKEKYLEMFQVLLNLFDPVEKIRLISGGASYADHIAVVLYLEDPNKYSLKLHLPTIFNQTKLKYQEISNDMYDCGIVINKYHMAFSRKMGLNSFQDIDQAIRIGAETIVSKGFKTRNTKIANDSDVLIAFTFGNGAILKDGGSADTMRKFLRHRGGFSHHVDLNSMQVYSPAIVLAEEKYK